MVFLATKGNIQTDIYLFITNILCTCVIYVYVQIHQIFTKKYQIYICTILSNTPVIATGFFFFLSVHELRFYHVVRGTMGPEGAAFPEQHTLQRK